MFSIITTTYNASATIEETINSVLGQSFTIFEWIMVDDGSTDNNIEVIRKYKDSRIKIYGQQKIGRANALNFGIQKAQNPFVCIIDADDLWHKEKLKLAHQTIQDIPEADIICTELKTFTKDIPLDDPLDNNIDIKKVSFEELVKYNYVCHSSAVIRKDLALYNPDRKTQVDYELWLRLSDQGAVICLQKAKLTYHRLHANQNFEGKSNFKYRMNAVRLTQKYAAKNNLWLTYIWIPIFYFLGFIKQLIVYRKIK